MQVSAVDQFDPNVNLVLRAYTREEDGALTPYAERRLHNVMTTTGRNWLVRLLGASNNGASPPTAHTTAKIKYIGLGAGGCLQTDTRLLATQVEHAGVLALEDPVPFSVSGTTATYLKAVRNQVAGTQFFPGDGRTIFVLDVLETEVSFTGSAARGSGTVLNTAVPVSEAGLYLSTATPTYDQTNNLGVDPTAANQLVCYGVFDPVPVNPNTVLRVEWELRL